MSFARLNPDYQRLRQIAKGLSPGTAKLDTLEEIARLCDTLGDVEEGLLIRNEIIDIAVFHAAPQRAIVAFAWCLAQSDRDPKRFPETRHFWRYKWIAGCLDQFFVISRQQIEDTIADMRLRYSRNGKSLKAVYQIQMNNAMSMGDDAEVPRLYRLWQDAKRDDSTDCSACLQASDVRYHLFMKNYTHALDEAQPLVTGQMRCAEVPHSIYARLLLPLLKLGRREQAAEFHRIGYPMVARNPTFTDSVGKHLCYLGMTNQIEAGIRLLRKHLAWPFIVSTPDDQFTFFHGAWHVVEQLSRRYRWIHNLKLPTQFPLYNASNTYSVAALRDWIEGWLAETAAKFDARNGNSKYLLKLTEMFDQRHGV